MNSTTPSADELPIFPLGNPLLPAGLLHLNIFEPRYLAMTTECLRTGSPFGVALIQAGFEVGVPAIPAAIGCTARIIEWQRPAPDRYQLTVRGESIFKIGQRRSNDAGLILANVRLIDPPDPIALPLRYVGLAKLIQELVDAFGADSPIPLPLRLDDAAWVANRWAELLPVTPERRQRWLEQGAPLAALAEVEQVLAQQSGGGERP